MPKLIIQIKAINIHENDTNAPVVFFFNYNGVFRADGLDITTKTLLGATIPRTVSSLGGGNFAIYYRDPAQSTITGGTPILLEWGSPTVNVANDLTTWQNCHGSTDDWVLVAHGEEAAANLVDDSGNYTATDSGITYQETGKIGSGFGIGGGANLSNWGDVTQFNSAATFTIQAWLNVTNLALVSATFLKYDGSPAMFHAGYITGGNLYFYLGAIANYVRVNTLSNYMTNNVYAHVTFVYDGSQVGNLGRGKIYINAVSRADASAGVIPATMPNMAGISFAFGYTVTSFNGFMDEVRCFTGALTENQIKTQYDNQRLFSTNGSFDISNLNTNYYYKYW